ncbi:TIGR03086 family metal-binding protein [Actinomadura rugatobispora]|uniref:TIGR03086 family metal-binding protein n=1 Tax=Actinomadura rugatobispora TaxID=1994 RepID=A0ABW1A6I0_9ACTN
MTIDAIRELDRRAVLATVDVANRAGPADLSRPTPCAGWTLGDLLAHMTAQHHGFAASARGEGADLGAWKVRPPGTVKSYAEAADAVIAAFAGEGVAERDFALPEFGPGVAVPAEQAMGFHFIDYVVHGWDVARALDLPYELDAELLEAARPIALAVPDGDFRLEPGAAFAPALGATGDPGSLDEILLALGRSPAWPRVEGA